MEYINFACDCATSKPDPGLIGQVTERLISIITSNYGTIIDFNSKCDTCYLRSIIDSNFETINGKLISLKPMYDQHICRLVTHDSLQSEYNYRILAVLGRYLIYNANYRLKYGYYEIIENYIHDLNIKIDKQIGQFIVTQEDFINTVKSGAIIYVSNDSNTYFPTLQQKLESNGYTLKKPPKSTISSYKFYLVDCNTLTKPAIKK
jgi:hypothetical protein